MPLVVDIAGRDLVFDVDDHGRLRVSVDGVAGVLAPAQCGELVALGRAALRGGQQGLDLGDVEGEVEARAHEAESVSEAAAPAAAAASRTAPSVEEIEKAVRELKDAVRGQRRLAF